MRNDSILVEGTIYKNLIVDTDQGEARTIFFIKNAKGEYYKIFTYSNVAEVCAKYLDCNSRVRVRGRITKQFLTRANILARTVEFLPKSII